MAAFTSNNYFNLDSFKVYSITEALDLEEATGRRYNWVDEKTRNRVSIGRPNGKYVEPAKPQPIKESRQERRTRKRLEYEQRKLNKMI